MATTRKSGWRARQGGATLAIVSPVGSGDGGTGTPSFHTLTC